jgi:hypothetical protein
MAQRQGMGLGLRQFVPIVIAVSSLGGCILPPAVTAVSLAADGASYAATGKTLSDHGLSAATGQDCAMVRGLNGTSICTQAAGRGEGAPVEQGKAGTRPKGDAPATADVPHDQYVTLGSFYDFGSAARAQARYADLKPVIARVAVGQKPLYRVVVGPLSREEAAALRTRLSAEAAA